MFVVALTGHALPDDQQRASEAGFDAHLAKPATIARIQEVIGRAPLRPPPRTVRQARSPSPVLNKGRAQIRTPRTT
jgi:CheY-like chemotaxis protein